MYETTGGQSAGQRQARSRARIMTLALFVLAAISSVAHAGYEGFKAALVEDAALRDFSVRVFAGVQKTSDYFVPSGPVPNVLDLRTDDWLTSLDHAKKTFQAHRVDSLVHAPPSFSLNASATAIQGQVLRAEAQLTQAVSQLDVKTTDAEMLQQKRDYVAGLERFVRKTGDRLGYVLQAMENHTDYLNLTEVIPESLSNLDTMIRDKRAEVLASRRAEASALQAQLQSTLQALAAEEVATKAAIEANRKKMKKMEEMTKALTAAALGVQNARYDEVEAAEQLDAATTRLTQANKDRQSATSRVQSAQKSANAYQATVNDGPWVCENGNTWDTCKHKEKFEWQNRYNNAVNSINGARDNLNRRKAELKTADDEVLSSTQNRSQCVINDRMATERRQDLETALAKMRQDVQPLIDEIWNLIFASGSQDSLTDIAATRQRLTSLLQRAQGAAQ